MTIPQFHYRNVLGFLVIAGGFALLALAGAA
jgi:hypothetical protein